MAVVRRQRPRNPARHTADRCHRHRYRLAPYPERRGVEHRRNRETESRDRSCRLALVGGRECAGARTYQDADRRLRTLHRKLQTDPAQPCPLRYIHRYIQFHAGARLDAHRPRLHDARRLESAAFRARRLYGVRPLHLETSRCRIGIFRRRKSPCQSPLRTAGRRRAPASATS